MAVLVVIPAHNEAASLPTVVGDLRARHPEHRILVVDDGSTDDTPSIVRRLGVSWLRLPASAGVGTAMRAGFRFAVNEGFDVVVRIDGDGQHDERSVDALLAPILRNEADVARGSRYLTTTTYQAAGFRRFAQHVAARLLSAVTQERVTDPTSGFWAFGLRAIRLLAEHHPTGYPEPELLLLLHRNRLTTVEIPVHMRERLAGRTTLGLAPTMVAVARVLLALLIVPLRPAVNGQP